MLLEVWISTNKFGSECSDTIEIPDEDIEGLDEDGRNKIFEEYARDVIWNMAEWGFREVENHV